MRLPWPLIRVVNLHTRQIGMIMATLEELQAAVAREREDTARIVGVVDTLTGAVEALIARAGTTPPEVQAAIDEAVATLGGTAADTASVEARLNALTDAANGTPTPEEPAPGELTP